MGKENEIPTNPAFADHLGERALIITVF